MKAASRKGDAPIENVRVECYTVPTETPESDGTFTWDKTTMVLVELTAGGERGIGYSYADLSAGLAVESLLADEVKGKSALDIPAAYAAMQHQVRNAGAPGIASMAISAVDVAMWDLKGRLLGMSVLDLLGARRSEAAIYGSGGFCSYSLERLRAQLGGWAEQGMRMVKMKIGRDAAEDRARVRAAREAIGAEVELFVDANGGYSRKEALAQAEEFAGLGVTWFEEPVSADDLEGLRMLRDRAPAPIEIAAGEYGFEVRYFRRMLEAGAVDVLQADATRCGGFTGFLQAAALCDAFELPFSFHCAPALHAAVACAAPRFYVGEYFFDHYRIEQMFFEGLPELVDGALRPDRSRPGLGLDFKRAEAARYAV